MNKKIVVLYGGNSSERKISIKSGNAIFKSLLRLGFKTSLIDTKEDFILKIKNKFDKAYIALHGKGGEDGSIQGILEYLKIPYTGSGIAASSIAIDKYKTKLIWKACNLLTPPSIYLKKKT